MCIKVIRWFYCPVQGQDPPVPPQRALTNTYPNFWTHWQHGETVGRHEQRQRNLPTFQGYRYVHHKDERWIRCAMTNATACLQYPLEIRTELYDIACQECTQDDPCILSAQPAHTYKNPSPNMTADILANIADAYAYEIITLMTSFYRMQISGLGLEESAWDVYQRGLYCTLESDHIIRDRARYAEGPLRYPCFTDCVCSARPWAHNVSRAARNQDAAQVRIRAAQQWFYFAHTDYDPSLWADRHFADIPNQLWLNMHEDGPQRYAHLVSQITTAVYQLDRLGPTIQAGGIGSRFKDSVYHRTVRLGQSTATQLIAFPCLDPGITTDFLDLLMRNHFLTALCPYLDTTNDRRYTLDCQQPPSEAMGRLLFFSCGAFREVASRLEASRAGIRQATLMNALGRNRAICHHNALIKKQVAEGFALSWVVNSSYAAGKTKTCHICTDDFDDVNAESQIPEHLRAIETRCCHQFMHVRCLKGTVLQREKCPLCNSNLEDIGFSTQRIAPDQHVQQEVDRGELPEGLMEHPNMSERLLVESNRHLIRNYIRNRMAEELATGVSLDPWIPVPANPWT